MSTPSRDASPAAPASSASLETPWDSPTSPLSLAAYVTWLAVVLNPLQQTLRGDRWPEAREVVALVALLLVLALFVGTSIGAVTARNPRRSRAFVLLQAAFALVAIAALPAQGSLPVLLIIVAAQVFIVFERRAALLVVLAVNAVLGALLARSHGIIAALPVLLSYAGFQAFAALTTSYARR